MKSTLFLLLLFPLTAFSQIWYVGGKSGVTFSNYSSKTDWDEGTHVGYTVGATAFKQINTRFGLGFELQYIQKGYNNKLCSTISDKLNSNFLEVPIMADYVLLIPGTENLRAHANVGFYSAYWLSGKYKMKGFDQREENYDFDLHETKRFDFGPLAGGRIEYIFKNGLLSLDFRYEMGIIDLQKSASDNTKNINKSMIVGLSYWKVLNF